MLLQVSGIIVGMLLMGYIADQIGRKWGSALTAAFMFIGGIMLTASNGVTIQGWAIMFAVSQFIFGCARTLPDLHVGMQDSASLCLLRGHRFLCRSSLFVPLCPRYGVGGEYPLASSSAAERAEANKALRFRRGEMVVCTFSMQVG